jgi:peptidoglycan-associated lipoprotein
MMTHPGARLRLEGHTDERGGTEYNLALGQRRADGVRRTMVQAGVPEMVLEAVSLGEEMPVDPAHGESAWALNRRVELRYLSR